MQECPLASLEYIFYWSHNRASLNRSRNLFIFNLKFNYSLYHYEFYIPFTLRQMVAIAAYSKQGV